MLPRIQFQVPGCGVTPFNVWGLSFQWWREYRDLTLAIEKQNREAGRGKH